MAVEFQQRPWSIEAAAQARLLSLCNVDPGLYGEEVDPSAFTALAILEALRNDLPMPTGVHSGQDLTVHRIPRLGEALILSGHMSDSRAVERGQMVGFVARLHDGSGGLVVESVEQFLVLDSNAPKARGSTVAEAAAATTQAGEVVFRPAQVAGYCGTNVNPIHFDPIAAEKAGFRAPIIGGEQGVRALMALLWTLCRPSRLRVELSFLRPIFWDDHCTLTLEESAGRPKTLALEKGGKKAARLAILSIEHR